VLVLDNCEHVRAGAAELVARLTGDIEGLTVLATSREALEWAEEQLLPLPALSMDEAVALLRQGGSVDDEAAERICRSLDRNPLFIRLAAARLGQLSVAALLAELDGSESDARMRWEQTDDDPRHRRLGDAIAWSYRLSTPAEQLLLQRLSVFAAGAEVGGESDDDVRGGADFAAIRAVCCDDEIVSDEVAGLLERLILRSLAAVHADQDEPRYYLLESVRLFAFEKLPPADAATFSARHRRHYRDRVAERRQPLFTTLADRWMQWARGTLDNILLAVESSTSDPNEALVGLDIAAAMLSAGPLMRGGQRAAALLTERMLPATRGLDQPMDVRLAALTDLAWIAVWQGRGPFARELVREAVQLTSTNQDVDDPEVDAGLSPLIEYVWALDLFVLQRDARTIGLFLRAGKKFALRGEAAGTVRCRLMAAIAAGILADRMPDWAAPVIEAGRARGGHYVRSWAGLAQSLALSNGGDPAHCRAALELQLATLRRQHPVHDAWTVLWLLIVRTWTLTRAMTAGVEDLEPYAAQTARLLGTVEPLQHTMGVAMEQLGLVVHERAMAESAARTVLGDRFDALFAEGARIPADEAGRAV
jgi:predicted ATPase